MIRTVGYATKGPHRRLRPVVLERAEPAAGEVEIDVLFCGVCHSDIHQVKNEWDNTVYPCMPGHEIVGRVAAAGADVTKFKTGDLVGVGCMIDSCRHCEPCAAHEENYCEGPNGWLATYNGPMVPAAAVPDATNHYGRDNTFGGYSGKIVVREEFVLRIPEKLDPASAAPILCAGVTTFSPLRHWRVEAGQTVGIVGFGGLGHLAVKLAEAMGAKVVVFTSTPDKLEEARLLGITAILESDEEAFRNRKSSFDFILSTVPESHDINPFIALLKRDCAIVVVGALEAMRPIDNMEVALHRKTVAGSLIGSIAETQAVLDFCAEYGVRPDIEIIPIQEINKAFKLIERGDVRFRYVIDMSTLESEEDAERV
jgi:uncharacterized zinc-type alcohol dehydrogenase-like protein